MAQMLVFGIGSIIPPIIPHALSVCIWIMIAKLLNAFELAQYFPEVWICAVLCISGFPARLSELWFYDGDQFRYSLNRFDDCGHGLVHPLGNQTPDTPQVRSSLIVLENKHFGMDLY